MSRITIVAIASWSLALVAAGAFAYVLSSPAVPQAADGVASLSMDPITAVLPAMAALHHETGEALRLIVVPTTVITTSGHRHAMLEPPPAHRRELAEMTCSSWRHLEQGDPRQLVRSCD